MLFLDGAYLLKGAHSPLFLPVAGPSANELQRLVEQIAVGVGQALERRGLIERAIENAWLASDNEAGPLDDLIGHPITYRIAVGPRAGQKLFTLQTVPPLCCAITRSRRRGHRQTFVMQAIRHRSGVHPEGLAGSTVGWRCRGGHVEAGRVGQ